MNDFDGVTRKLTLGLALWALAVGGAGCGPGKVEVDGGAPPPDLCNSVAESKSNVDCQLPLGVLLSTIKYDGGRYLSTATDKDYYSITLPAAVSSKSLLHVTGGYNFTGAPVPNTAVNFFLNVVRDDGLSSLISGVDSHLTAAPKPVDLIKPLTDADANKLLYLTIADQPSDPKHPQFDAHHPYDLRAEVVQNPDANEPNDVTPTALNLTDQGGYLGAKTEGYLATQADVDRFSMTIPAGRKIIYLHLDLARVNNPTSKRPPNYRLSYTLFAPDGKTAVSQGRALNASSQTNLTDARLAAVVGVPTAGNYTLVIQGYKDSNTVGPVPGDLDFKYTADVRVFDDVDANEGANSNDAIANATTMNVGGVGSSTTKTGRLSYVGDRDWFALHIGSASGSHSLLHFKLSYGAKTSRFPVPLPGSADHEVRVFTNVTSSGGAACISSDTVCPKGYLGSNDPWVATVQGYCSQTLPLCLWSSRTENLLFTNLKNMEGAVAIAPNGPQDYLILVQDDGNDWADDNDYVLTASIDADADEDSKGVPINSTLPALTSATNFTGAQTFSGTLAAGHGSLLSTRNGGFDSSKGEGLIGPEDYDAVVDGDQFVLAITPPALPPLERNLAMQWTVQNNADGTKPYDLAVKVQYCADATCAPATYVTSGTVGFTTSTLDNGGQASWWNQDWLLTALLPLFDTQGTPPTVTINPYACFCIEPKYMAFNKVILTAYAADRTNYDPAKTYTLRVGNSPYTEAFTLKDGGTGMCPQPTITGTTETAPGCKITGQ